MRLAYDDDIVLESNICYGNKYRYSNGCRYGNTLCQILTRAAAAKGKEEDGTVTMEGLSLCVNDGREREKQLEGRF